MRHYHDTEIEILQKIADVSLNYGEVELKITTESEDGVLIPEIVVRSAPDAVVRALAEEDDLVASLDLDWDGLHIMPNPLTMNLEEEAARDPEAE